MLFRSFIHKTNIDNIKLVFYDFGGIKNFKIKVKDYVGEFNTREWDEIVLPFFDCDEMVIEHDGELFDLTKEIKNIGCNKFIKQ